MLERIIGRKTNDRLKARVLDDVEIEKMLAEAEEDEEGNEEDQEET